MARGVPIYWIGKLSPADMTKFSISAIGTFEIEPIFLPIFSTNTNGLILFNTRLSCDHFLLR